MQKRYNNLMVWVLFALLIAVPACGSGNNTTAAVPAESEDSPPDATVPLLTNTPIPTDTPAPTDTATPTPPPAPPLTNTPAPTNFPGPSGCSNSSEFVGDITVPDNSQMSPNEVFTKIWRIKNNDSCTWTRDYQFVFVEGEQMGAPQAIPLTKEVPPGENHDVSVVFTAPTTPGTYRSRWQLRAPDGALFGARPFVQIVVPPPTDESTEMTDAEVGENTDDILDEIAQGVYLTSPPPGFYSYLLCPSSLPELPGVTGRGASYGSGKLCLYDFPLTEEIVVDLYVPSGGLAGSAVFRVVENEVYQTKPILDEPRLVGSAGAVDDVTTIQVGFWLPAGMPTGDWFVVANSDTIHAEGSFKVEYLGPTISTVPDTEINPFEDHRCGLYSIGDTVIVHGTQFDPDIWLTLEIYYDSSAGFVVQSSHMVQVDGAGSFSVSVPVESLEPRIYYVVAILDEDTEPGYNLTRGYHPRASCFKVEATLPKSEPEQITDLIFSSDTIHIGDEQVPGWPNLTGNCFFESFYADLPVQVLTLELMTYGAEADNWVELNGQEVAIISPQGSLQPNWWTELRSISLPKDYLIEDEENTLAICSGPVEVEPEFPGDIDDFQFRNLRLLAR